MSTYTFMHRDSSPIGHNKSSIGLKDSNDFKISLNIATQECINERNCYKQKS